MKKLFTLLTLTLGLMFNVTTSQKIQAQDAEPVITTDTRYARGATKAFGRISVTANGYLFTSRGVCCSTNPEPTVNDFVSTKTYSNNGTIYCVENLEPATEYYMRAYASTKEGKTFYGNTIRFYTIPKGSITWGYNDGGPADANTRIRAALTSATDYWNNLTSIKGLYINCSYGSGTPTAEASYGGYMRVGPNASYQKTGTILHEMGHNVGVGQHDRWYGSSSPLRAGAGTGNWTGYRANKVLQFWKNDDAACMEGDGTHMWPYGVNGAHEDNGSDALYTINGLITQGLGEDGLPPTWSTGVATPAWVFEHEKEVKYYIKNENEKYGLLTAYLYEDENKALKWIEMNASDAIKNDSLAWLVTFNPATGYYQLQNAATKHFVSCSGSEFRLVEKSSATSDENLQLLVSRQEVKLNATTSLNKHSYWIVHPDGNLTPSACFTGSIMGRTTYKALDFTDAATQQRWIFLQADELQGVEDVALTAARSDFNTMIKNIEELIETPHVEKEAGALSSLQATLKNNQAEVSAENATVAGIQDCTEAVRKAAFTFLGKVDPTSINEPFDLSSFLTNGDISSNEGWTGTAFTFASSCGEFYETTFNIYQTLQNLPKGQYEATVRAFQRPGAGATTYNEFINGTNNVKAELFFGSSTAPSATLIRHIAEDASSIKLGGSELEVGNPVMYIPNNQAAAQMHFLRKHYTTSLIASRTSSSLPWRIGLRCTTNDSKYWTCFDQFKLYFYGSLEPTAIEQVQAQANVQGKTGVYNLMGVQVKADTQHLNALPAGIYIVNGKKCVVK